MQDFKNLDVWQRFGLTSQMRRASVAISSNIAEGCGRKGDRQFGHFLEIAMGSACELESEAILSVDLEFITEAVQQTMLLPLIDIKRMLSGLMSSLDTTPRPRREPKADS